MYYAPFENFRYTFIYFFFTFTLLLSLAATSGLRRQRWYRRHYKETVHRMIATMARITAFCIHNMVLLSISISFRFSTVFSGTSPLTLVVTGRIVTLFSPHMVFITNASGLYFFLFSS